VTGWGTTSADQVAHVVCRNRTGAALDTYFAFSFVSDNNQSGSTSGRGAYIWADQAASASYTPSAFYNWESNGKHVKVARSSKGVYTASLTGLSGLGGSAQVTAYGTAKTRCQLGSLPTTGTIQKIGVRCFTYAGSPVDSRFSLAYGR
jgi:hypothetical protein